jgi:hypothetical protein
MWIRAILSFTAQIAASSAWITSSGLRTMRYCQSP